MNAPMKTIDVGIVIRELGGFCPVQATGTIDGSEFYFRSRGAHWTMGIGGEPILSPSWFYSEEYGTWPEAGYITEEEARTFISKAATLYRVSLR